MKVHETVSAARKIKILLAATNHTIKSLAELLGTSPLNLSNKMKRDNFSEKELQEIAEVLGAKVKIHLFWRMGRGYMFNIELPLINHE